MKLKMISIENIRPALYNPRKDLQPGDPEYEKLKRSIEAFGYVEPIVWNERTGNLVGGHQRFKILLTQGVKQVPVSVVDLDEQQEKALNLALNKIEGDWDEECLSTLLSELNNDFLSLTGFEDNEIEKLLKFSEPAEIESFEVIEEEIDYDYECPKCGYHWKGQPR